MKSCHNYCNFQTTIENIEFQTVKEACLEKPPLGQEYLFQFEHNLGIGNAYRNRNTNKSILVIITTNNMPRQHVPIFFSDPELY